MDERYTAAVKLLASFRQNEPVQVVKEGHTNDMYVSRTIHRSDGMSSPPESSRVTVTYGPGRYATEITADMLVLGLATIEARDDFPGEEAPCFCGEAIDYDKPGDEGGEFIASEEFVRRYPQYKVGETVIGHAQCGLDHGLEPE